MSQIPTPAPTVGIFRTVTFWALVVGVITTIWQQSGKFPTALGNFTADAQLILQGLATLGVLVDHISAVPRKVSLKMPLRKLGPLCLMVFMAILFMGGCAAQQQRQACYQAIISDDAAVKATTALVPAQVSVQTAQQIYAGAVTARAALATWAAAIAANDPNTITTASNAATAALGTLSQELAAAQAESVTLRHRHVAAKFLTAKKAKLSPAEAIAVIQLAADMAPVLTNWINSVFNASNVTDAQIAGALATLDVDLAALKVAIQNATPAGP